MGCCSSDEVPDAPEEVKPDPGMSAITVEVAPLGMFGGSRDFGVWMNSRPKDSGPAKKAIWLWFNKSDTGPNQVRIDLENFKRGHVPEAPDKGKVLFYCTMEEKPQFQSFQRVASSGFDSFYGLFGTGSYADPEDAFYLGHPQHTSKLRANAATLGHVITKWQMNTKVLFYDGETGRGADIIKKDAVELEVYAKGSNATTYQRWTETTTDSEGHRHTHTRHGKPSTELVDRIEYRLTFQGALWAQWFVEGDTNTSTADPTIDCPLFSTTIGGGWFQRTFFRTVTKDEVDPALAILISHVCASEYSVAQIKKDMAIPTPEHFPGATGFLGSGITGLVMLYPAAPTNGAFHFGRQANPLAHM